MQRKSPCRKTRLLWNRSPPFLERGSKCSRIQDGKWEDGWLQRKLSYVMMDHCASKAKSNLSTCRVSPTAWPDVPQSLSAAADTPQTSPSAMGLIRPLDF